MCLCIQLSRKKHIIIVCVITLHCKISTIIVSYVCWVVNWPKTVYTNYFIVFKNRNETSDLQLIRTTTNNLNVLTGSLFNIIKTSWLPLGFATVKYSFFRKSYSCSRWKKLFLFPPTIPCWLFVPNFSKLFGNLKLYITPFLSLFFVDRCLVASSNRKNDRLIATTEPLDQRCPTFLSIGQILETKCFGGHTFHLKIKKN
jgi:hypothetical protein